MIHSYLVCVCGNVVCVTMVVCDKVARACVCVCVCDKVVSGNVECDNAAFV